MKHNLIVEGRHFSADIKALCDYDEGFQNAWQDGTSYEMAIMLSDLFEICPRSYKRTLMYARLVRFLGMKDITLRVMSRKTKKQNGHFYGNMEKILCD